MRIAPVLCFEVRTNVVIIVFHKKKEISFKNACDSLSDLKVGHAMPSSYLQCHIYLNILHLVKKYIIGTDDLFLSVFEVGF